MPFAFAFFPFPRRRRRPVEIIVEGGDPAKRKSRASAAKEMLAERGLDVLTLTEDDGPAKAHGLVADVRRSRRERASVRAYLVLGRLRRRLECADYAKRTGESFDVILHEGHPSTDLRLFGGGRGKEDACVREMFDLLDGLLGFVAPPAVTLFLRDERRTRERDALDEVMRERVARGGTVYEIRTGKLSEEEIATRMCEASVRSHALLRA